MISDFKPAGSGLFSSQLRRYCWSCFIPLLCLLGVSGCSQQMDPSLQTPITRETLDAFRNPPLIQNQQQAALAALRKLGESRLEYNQPPKVISVAKMSNRAAMKHLATSGMEDFTVVDREVWLVVFEGEFRIVPFGPGTTPGAFGHRCVWVVIGVENDQGGRVKSAPCENK